MMKCNYIVDGSEEVLEIIFDTKRNEAELDVAWAAMKECGRDAPFHGHDDFWFCPRHWRKYNDHKE